MYLLLSARRSERAGRKDALFRMVREQADEAIVADGKEDEVGVMGVDERHGGGGFNVKSFFWHGGSVWDAWFSCASNQVSRQTSAMAIASRPDPTVTNRDSFLQVAQVLLTLPYSFSQLGMLSGVLLQIFYGILGSWTAYIISVLYVEYRSRKEKEGVSFKNHVIQVYMAALRRVSLGFTFSPRLPPSIITITP
jgi:auxin influx carrier (AUX1 LAX family)